VTAGLGVLALIEVVAGATALGAVALHHARRRRQARSRR
jgi:hypothetical protein